MRRLFLLTLIGGLFLLGITPARLSLLAQEDAGEQEKSEKKIETVTAETKPLKIYETMDGVFESRRMHEIKADFENWTDLKIDMVVDEGTEVREGELLLRFDTESIQKALKENQFAVQNAQFDLEMAKLAMKEASATHDLDRQMAENTWKNAQEDYEYYRQVQLPQQLDDLDYDEKSAGYFLEYSKDELDQLEKMYTEDELTEESEEIVLKRARRSVESAERSRDRTLMRVKRAREMDIPREQVSKDDARQRAEISFEKSMITLPIQKQKTEIALAQAEFALKNKQESLDELETDFEKMNLTAPADGVLYYGQCKRGKWVGASGSAARQLEPDKKITANSVLMTVVDIGALRIRADVDEAKLDEIEPGLKGQALVASANNRVLPVTVTSVSRIPLDDGKFDCQIELGEMPPAGTIMPGMSCKLSFLVYENDNAVCVPKASVFSDDGGITHYVYVVGDGQPVRRDVVTGYTSDDQIEIKEGLSAGDVIAKSKP